MAGGVSGLWPCAHRRLCGVSGYKLQLYNLTGNVGLEVIPLEKLILWEIARQRPTVSTAQASGTLLNLQNCFVFWKSYYFKKKLFRMLQVYLDSLLPVSPVLQM